MIMPIFQKTFVRQTTMRRALTVTFIAAATAFTVSSAQALPRWQYFREVTSALPSGTTIENAPSPALQEAVQRVILAHPASEAPAIAGALAKGAPLERAKEIAEAIAKLFPNHPALAGQAVEIAREMTRSIIKKLGPSAQGGDSKGVVELDFKDTVPQEDITPDTCATEIGNVAAILAYYLNPDDFLDQFERAILDVIDDPEIREKVRQTLRRLKGDEVMFPPGYIIRHETPITNG